MARLIIPTPLRKFTDNEGTFESPGSTVKDVIQDLINQYNGLKQHLIDDNGSIRSFVRVYVGNEDINRLEGENTPIHRDALVSIIPAIAGGLSRIKKWELKI